MMLKLLFHFKKNSFVQKFKSIFVREFHIERTYECDDSKVFVYKISNLIDHDRYSSYYA